MVVKSPADYLEQLQALLPFGPAWPHDAQVAMTRVLSAWAEEFSRVDARLASLMDEADPRTTNELLTDWERVAGLPDPCTLAIGGEQTVAQRRAALVARLTGAGGQTPAYYIALAASLGFVITITEFHARTVDDDFDYPMYDDAWNFAWQVNAPAETVFERTVDDTFDDPLAWWGNGQLECVINRVKPAHTVVLFSYSN